ncbi:hypothetical protein NE237_009811 [Protea cynaroides]|uniref:Uncharacterized protein n=1 Tax=Protea cynaroides TaxID=273540 RepID=A0A9Q0KYI2_9MAGN|nr:hypothetical protein NE237_009811 [Protea cynaroides]
MVICSEECKKDVPVVLIDMHNCSLESRIKMNLEARVVDRVAEGNKPVEKKKPAERKRKAASSEPKANKTDFGSSWKGFKGGPRVGSETSDSSSVANGFSAAVATVVRAPPKDFKVVREEWAAIRIQTASRA